MFLNVGINFPPPTVESVLKQAKTFGYPNSTDNLKFSRWNTWHLDNFPKLKLLWMKVFLPRFRLILNLNWDEIEEIVRTDKLLTTTNHQTGR